jgi:AraC-like DNA-binding protein
MDSTNAFSTLRLPPGRRVAAWTEQAADRFVESSFKVQNPDGFVASMLNRDMGELSLTRILSAGHSEKRVTRSQAQAARAAEDFFLVSVQLAGRCRLGQRGRDTWLAPGDYAIYDTRAPYELVLQGDYQQAVMRIPRHALSARLPGCDAMVARTVAARTLPARLLTQTVREACGADAQLGASAANDIADALLSLLTAGLRGLAEGAPNRVVCERPLDRVKAHVRAHLADPSLGVATIAEALGWSASYLHKLFKDEPATLERWIWRQRLVACEQALRDRARDGQTLTAIAFEHGFSDAAHFSRRFQEQYGCAPGAYRRAALSHRSPGHP